MRCGLIAFRSCLAGEWQAGPYSPPIRSKNESQFTFHWIFRWVGSWVFGSAGSGWLGFRPWAARARVFERRVGAGKDCRHERAERDRGHSRRQTGTGAIAVAIRPETERIAGSAKADRRSPAQDERRRAHPERRRKGQDAA